MNAKLLYYYIAAVRIFFPRFWGIHMSVIVAQSRIETANFKSRNCKENKNLFGMQHSSGKNRKTTSTGSDAMSEYGKQAVYESYADSITDYFLRQQNNKTVITNQGDIAYIDSTIKSGYAEAGNYRQMWLEIYTQERRKFNMAAVVGCAVTLIGWWFI